MGVSRGAILAALLLAGCVTTASPTADGHGRLSDRRLGTVNSISFIVSSWGYPVQSFEIASDGSGSFGRPPQERAETVVNIRFNAGPAGFERIRTILQTAERYATRPIPCRDRATDFPYGGVTWRTARGDVTMNFNLGCWSREMGRVDRLMQDAASAAEEFARDHPVQ